MSKKLSFCQINGTEDRDKNRNRHRGGVGGKARWGILSTNAGPDGLMLSEETN